MEILSTSSSYGLSGTSSSVYYDEISMQQSLIFSDSRKELKNLRSQLYSAAEYFELSYTNDDQKQRVVDTLKDYAVRALFDLNPHTVLADQGPYNVLADQGHRNAPADPFLYY